MEFSSNGTIGMELRLHRTAKGVSLREASDKIGIGESYLSEIERMKRNPSDEIIKRIGDYYNIDKKYLYDRFDRIPLSVQKELKENETLSRTLYEISINDTLSETDKDNLYTAMEALYRTHTQK